MPDPASPPAPTLPAPGSVPAGGPGFLDIDQLRDAHGLVAIISQRRATGMMTLGIFKEFDRDGKLERTAFIPEAMFEAYNELVKLAQERIAEIHAKGLEPIKVEPRGAYAR